MCSTDWDAALQEANELAALEADHARRVDEQNAEWKAKWPKHCTACGGWGCITFYQGHPYGSTTAYEQMADPCDALPATQCHRCGEHGLDEDGNGPCKSCGWNCDDGLHEV